MLKAMHLSKKYGNYEALKDLNLTVLPGDIYCLLGANGAGKSTTINIFMNFVPATEGYAIINDLDTSTQARETKKHLAYIPENLMLYPQLTGIENLDFFCGLSGKNYSKDELILFLEKAGLQSHFIHKRVETYSKGMRQKVGIALAVAKNASVLLLDEPTSGLDPKASNEFSQLLLDLKEKGVATLMATHDLFRSKETGTHIGIMKSGQLVASFSAKDISYRDLEQLYLQHMHN